MSRNREIPKWLKELQENSWELELLISGGAIFTLFQVSKIWVDWFTQILNISPIRGYEAFLIFGVFGLETLKLGFILHLILRALWLAKVCINYVYPKGINKDKIVFRNPFKYKIGTEIDLQNQIIYVDRLCGLVMYLSIISTFVLAGLLFSFFIVYTLPIHLGVFGTSLTIFTLIIFGLYVLDLVFAGVLRKTKYLEYLFYPFFFIMDILSLRGIYKKSSLLFYSNVEKRKFFIGLLAFLLVSICFSYANLFKFFHWSNVFDQRLYKSQMTSSDYVIDEAYYRDEIKDDFKSQTAKGIHIQSKIIENNILELFITYRAQYDYYLNTDTISHGQNYLSDLFRIYLNNNPYNTAEWFSVKGENGSKMGITCLIPIEHLPEGKNILKINTHNQNKENNIIETITIPFWKDIK